MRYDVTNCINVNFKIHLTNSQSINNLTRVMKINNFFIILLVVIFAGCRGVHYGAPDSDINSDSLPVVYYTSQITPQSLLRIYHALGVEPDGPVCVKISTGESNHTNHLRPSLIRDLVLSVDGTIVECCTAYGGNRQDPKKHWQTIHEHGYDSLFRCDIMDEFGDMRIPVTDTTHLHYDIVGDHLKDYRWMINLAHFKGHIMGGYGGVLKNASIGVASTAGKAYIHSAGRTDDPIKAWLPGNLATGPSQDMFIESMAAAAQAVHNYMGGRVVYINVMNNLSVDCDCLGHPHKPKMRDLGICASLDPVACDQACLDMVFAHTPTKDDDNEPLMRRIDSRHGTYLPVYAERIGLGSRHYQLVDIK